MVSLGHEIHIELDPVLGKYRRVGGFGEHVWIEPVGTDGRATVHGLPSGAPLDVRLVDRGVVYEIALNPGMLEIGETREILWHLPTCGTVKGIVLDRDGAPLIGIMIVLAPNPTRAVASLLKPSIDVVASIESGPGGGFEFDRVPQGDYLCGSSPIRHPIGMMVARRVTVSDRTEPITLELRSDASCTIRGMVILNGTASQNVQVVATRSDAEGSLTAACTAQSGYSFKLGPLECVAYRLRAIGDRGEESDTVEWRNGDPDPVLQIQGK